MKNYSTCAISKSKLLLVLFISFLFSSSVTSSNLKSETNQSKVDTFNTFYDLSEFFKYRVMPGTNYSVRLSERLLPTCMAKKNKPFLYCASLIKGKVPENPPYSDDRGLECGVSHKVKYGYYGYDNSNNWCYKSMNFYFNKWFCKDFHKLDIAIYIPRKDNGNRNMYCASRDNKTCAKFTQKECEKIPSTFGIFKLDIGSQGSFDRSEVDTLSGKMFILHHVKNGEKFNPPSLSTSGYEGERVFYSTYDILEFSTPKDIKYMKFTVKTPSVGSNTKGSYFIKLQMTLYLDDRILGVKELVDPIQQEIIQFEYRGVAKKIPKGNHKLYLKIASYKTTELFAGEYIIDFEGYY